MLERNNISKQLLITFSVVLTMFIVGLAWALPTWWRAYACSSVQFNTIGSQGTNIFVTADQWGAVQNKCVHGDQGHDITAVWACGVGWFNKNNYNYSTTDVDLANIWLVDGETYWDDQYLPNIDQVFYFYRQTNHSKSNVNPNDYWAGTFSTSAFNKKNTDGPGMESQQLKMVAKRWAPINQVLYGVNYNTTGWQYIYTQ